MNKLIALLVFALLSLGANAQNLLGAWEHISTSENDEKLKTVAIFSDGYHVITTYDESSGKFIETRGGSWETKNGAVIEKIEFDSSKPERVGTESTFQFKVSNSQLTFLESGIKFTRIDNNQPGKLHGAWLMSGRVADGKNQLRDISGPRKTMKILSGTRFQWIAYNTKTKQFLGTGGGTYTTINGDYTESIAFFSKDETKVGLKIKFNFELIDGNWNHSGFSSKGDPIHEIWSSRK